MAFGQQFIDEVANNPTKPGYDYLIKNFPEFQRAIDAKKMAEVNKANPFQQRQLTPQEAQQIANASPEGIAAMRTIAGEQGAQDLQNRASATNAAIAPTIQPQLAQAGERGSQLWQGYQNTAGGQGYAIDPAQQAALRQRQTQLADLIQGQLSSNPQAGLINQLTAQTQQQAAAPSIAQSQYQTSADDLRRQALGLAAASPARNVGASLYGAQMAGAEGAARLGQQATTASLQEQQLRNAQNLERQQLLGALNQQQSQQQLSRQQLLGDLLYGTRAQETGVLGQERGAQTQRMGVELGGAQSQQDLARLLGQQQQQGGQFLLGTQNDQYLQQMNNEALRQRAQMEQELARRQQNMQLLGATIGGIGSLGTSLLTGPLKNAFSAGGGTGSAYSPTGQTVGSSIQTRFTP